MAEAIDGILMEDGSKQLLESATWYEKPDTHDEFSSTIVHYYNQTVDGMMQMGYYLRLAQFQLKGGFVDLQASLQRKGLQMDLQKKVDADCRQ